MSAAIVVPSQPPPEYCHCGARATRVSHDYSPAIVRCARHAEQMEGYGWTFADIPTSPDSENDTTAPHGAEGETDGQEA